MAHLLDIMYDRITLERSDPLCPQILHNSELVQQIGGDLVLRSSISSDTNPTMYYYLIYNSYEFFESVSSNHRDAYLYYRMRAYSFEGIRDLF